MPSEYLQQNFLTKLVWAEFVAVCIRVQQVLISIPNFHKDKFKVRIVNVISLQAKFRNPKSKTHLFVLTNNVIKRKETDDMATIWMVAVSKGL
jgi:hypothetical protein